LRDYKESEAVMKKNSKIPAPKFTSEDEEREFWATTDSTKYIDWNKAKRSIFPGLKPSVRSISLRLPELLIANVKVLANKRDIPYQTLLKTFLAERIEKEMRSIQEEIVPVKMKAKGTFDVTRIVGEGISSRTRQKIEIKASKAPRLKAGKALKAAVNK
jgi:predicted DNA binding CopG/RHH family protein